MADIKWSHFPSQTPGNADEVVGLHSGGNARFTIANIVAAVRNGLANIFVPKTDVGAAGGVAELDSTGKVPSAQLPPIASTAADVTYDNTQSGLTADDVQEAIDELAQGGGGGTTVVANPVGAATAVLTKLQVENTIYSVPSGGGGASEAQLAYVENGTTASRNYTAGQYICWNGLLYTADTVIASGATFYTSGGNKNLTECVGGGLNTLRSAIGVTTSVSINQQINGYGFYILNITPPKTGAIPFACGLTSAYSWYKGSFGVITDGNNGSPGILITNLESSSKPFQGTLTVYWITL